VNVGTAMRSSYLCRSHPRRRHTLEGREFIHLGVQLAVRIESVREQAHQTALIPRLLTAPRAGSDSAAVARTTRRFCVNFIFFNGSSAMAYHYAQKRAADKLAPYLLVARDSLNTPERY
jgi:hypothetical protein